MNGSSPLHQSRADWLSLGNCEMIRHSPAVRSLMSALASAVARGVFRQIYLISNLTCVGL